MSITSDLGSLNWNDWLRAIFSAAISAAASVITANPLASALGAPQFTPRQLGVMAASAALVAVAGILRKSPLPDRKTAIALLPGVHTMGDVEQIASATAPGVTPTPAVAAAILGKPVPQTAPVAEAPVTPPA
jgi:hypothetical protein